MGGKLHLHYAAVIIIFQHGIFTPCFNILHRQTWTIEGMFSLASSADVRVRGNVDGINIGIYHTNRHHWQNAIHRIVILDTTNHVVVHLTEHSAKQQRVKMNRTIHTKVFYHMFHSGFPRKKGVAGHLILKNISSTNDSSWVHRHPQAERRNLSMVYFPRPEAFQESGTERHTGYANGKGHTPIEPS